MKKASLDIAFVVLHFNTVNETNNLVVSIKQKIDTKSYKIVIVDNKSPNGSGVELAEKYKDDSFVNVVLSPENVGFARGNNTGIDFVRANYNAKYICCLNNDTLMIQDNFYHVLDEEYETSHAAVIGVKEIFRDNSSGSWVHHIWKLETYKEFYDSNASHLHLLPLNCRIKREISRILTELYKTLYKIRYSKKPQGNHPCLDPEYRHEDVTVGGCCVIFTISFFARLNGFDNRTYLYWEEELLHIALNKNKLLSVYTPKLCIKHLYHVSTKDYFGDDATGKEMFMARHSLDSLRIVIDELEKFEKENAEDVSCAR